VAHVAPQRKRVAIARPIAAAPRQVLRVGRNLSAMISASVEGGGVRGSRRRLESTCCPSPRDASRGSTSEPNITTLASAIRIQRSKHSTGCSNVIRISRELFRRDVYFPATFHDFPSPLGKGWNTANYFLKSHLFL